MRAKAAAKRSGVEFDLTESWAMEIVSKQKHKCAMTGIPFFEEHNTSAKIHPYAPSIDRVEPGAGYTQGNCRIVAYAVNVMLLDWGETVLYRTANGYLASRAGRTRQTTPNNINALAAYS